MFSYGVILLFFSHLPNVIQICDIMPCTNACCSIQFLLQKLQTLSVLFPPSELPNRRNPLLLPTQKRHFYEVTIISKELSILSSFISACGWSSNTFLSPYSLVSRTPSPTHNSVVYAPFYTSMWVEPMVELLCSRRGNRKMYITSVTPYIPGADGVKNSLVGACELFHN